MLTDRHSNKKSQTDTTENNITRIRVGDGGKGGHVLPHQKIRKNIFLGNYYVKLKHFWQKSCKIREFC